ncbi:MAG: RNA polymerase sigma-70 factor [Chitinophagaceae bacterium]|nr:RNA polymerase sigma-70 factor [Chitinophagaceae bacterium]
MSSIQSYTEKELLERIAEGDEDAYKLVFDRYWNKIYQVALSFLKVPDQAQDAVQQVFIKLWEKRNKLPEVENLDAWLFIVARNTIINILERIVSSRKGIQQIKDVVPEDYLTPSSMLEYKQVSEIIQDAVNRLPPQQALVFRLSREQGLTYAEIAERLHIAPATVKSHIIRALNSIREYVYRHTDRTLMVIWLLAAFVR